MASIMAQGGKILTRPTGGILATDCGNPCIDDCDDYSGSFCDPDVWPDSVFPVTGQSIGPPSVCCYGKTNAIRSEDRIIADDGLSGVNVYVCECHDRCLKITWESSGWQPSGGAADPDLVVDYVIELVPCT